MTTRLQRRIARATAGDDGTALVLALLVVLLVGATLAAVMDYTRTGLLIAPDAKQVRNETTYAQGAVEGAINAIRGSSTSGRAGWPCPEFVPPVAGTAVADQSFRVTCEGQAVPTTNPDGSGQPDFAVQTTGSPSEGIRQTGNHTLTVDGGVYSNGDVEVTGGATNRMNVFGTLFAEGACTKNRIFSTDALNCPSFEDTTGIGNDPDWPSAVDTSGRLTQVIAAGDADPVPTCTGSVTTFGPGYYGYTPEQLRARYGVSCGAANAPLVMHFTPGFYYFDYDSSWDLSGMKIVGGSAGPGLTARAMGSACLPAQPGVQFVFGGTSRIALSGSSNESAPQGLELCGPTTGQNDQYSTGFLQRIAMVGSVEGQADRDTGAGALTADAAAAQPSTSALDVGEARVIDDKSALVTAASGKTTTVTLSDLDVFDTVPRGARIERVRVRYSQREAATNSSLPGLPVGTILTGTPAAVRLSLTVGGTKYPNTPKKAETTLSCAASCEQTLVPDAGSAPFWRDFGNAGLSWEVDGPQAKNKLGGMWLNGVEVLVDWTAPTLRPLSLPCPGKEPSCALLSSGSNPRVHLHGTVYAPTAHLDLRVHNTGDVVFRRGIVARNLAVDVSASTTQTSAPFQLPGATPAGRKVLFKAYVDGATTPSVRACVTYDDSAPLSSGGEAAFPGWGLDIHRWAALRSPADGDSCAGVPAP